MGRPAVDRVGDRYGRLTVVAQAPSKGRNAYWLCRCDCGGTNVVRGNVLARGETRSCGCLLAEHCARRVPPPGRPWVDSPSYSAAHRRVRTMHGCSSEHPCVDCGSPAAEWSYNHTDPDELTEIQRGREVAFSADPKHYSPRCKSCHAKFDRQEVAV